MQFTIAFNFSVESSTQGLKQTLKLTDDNEFILSNNKNVQIQPAGSSAVPPMQFMSFGNKELAVTAIENPSGDRQTIRITLPITAKGSSLKGILPFSGVQVDASYQFIGYDNRGSLSVGDFNIPFPS